MNILLYKFFAVVAVLFVFAKQSEGNTLASLDEAAVIEKIITSPKFQNLQEKLINTATDEDSVHSKNALKEIRNELLQFPSNVGSSEAAKKSIEGIIEALRLVYGILHQANGAIDTASNLVKVQDTDGATKVVSDAFKLDRELVFIAGVPIHDAQGSVLRLAGSSALSGLKKAIISIQKAGTTAFELLEIAYEIVIAGIKEGGPAAEEAFKSARRIISTGLLAIYKHAENAAKHALEGIQNSVLQTINEVDVVPGIIDSLKTRISTDDSAALEAIAKLSYNLKSALRILSNETAIDAANILYEGVKSTIVESADAISFAKKELKEAGKLAEQNPEAAIHAVEMGIKRAQDSILGASAPGYLGFGAASEMAGKEVSEKLVPFVIEIEFGRVTAFDYLRLSKRMALAAIQGGDEASKEGIQTAIQMCDTAGIALYQDYSDAGIAGLRVIAEI